MKIKTLNKLIKIFFDYLIERDHRNVVKFNLQKENKTKKKFFIFNRYSSFYLPLLRLSREKSNNMKREQTEFRND